MPSGLGFRVQGLAREFTRVQYLRSCRMSSAGPVEPLHYPSFHLIFHFLSHIIEARLRQEAGFARSALKSKNPITGVRHPLYREGPPSLKSALG